MLIYFNDTWHRRTCDRIVQFSALVIRKILNLFYFLFLHCFCRGTMPEVGVRREVERRGAFLHRVIGVSSTKSRHKDIEFLNNLSRLWITPRYNVRIELRQALRFAGAQWVWEVKFTGGVGKSRGAYTRSNWHISFNKRNAGERQNCLEVRYGGRRRAYATWETSGGIDGLRGWRRAGKICFFIFKMISTRFHDI